MRLGKTLPDVYQMRKNGMTNEPSDVVSELLGEEVWRPSQRERFLIPAARCVES